MKAQNIQNTANRAVKSTLYMLKQTEIQNIIPMCLLGALVVITSGLGFQLTSINRQ